MQLCYARHAGCNAKCLFRWPADQLLACPDCDLSYSATETLYDSLPCPFVDQATAKACVVIKPSMGFFQTFSIGDDLHIGISDTGGVVHSFWTDGIMSETGSWDKSIMVCNLDVPELDLKLRTFIDVNKHKFQAETYRDVQWNCFDFVMEFMHSVDSRRVFTKAEFVGEYIQTPLKHALRYCKLYREVERRGCITIK